MQPEFKYLQLTGARDISQFLYYRCNHTFFCQFYLGLLFLFGVTLTITSYQLDENIADEIRDQLESNDEFLEDFAPNIDLNEDDDFEIPMNDPGFRLRRAVKRIVTEVRRPIRQVREVVRRVIVDPVRRVVREVTGGVTRLVRSRTLRFSSMCLYLNIS